MFVGKRRRVGQFVLPVFVGILPVAGSLAGADAVSREQFRSYSLFTTADASAAKVVPETATQELGVRFTPSRNGTVSAIRFLKAPGDTDTHTVTLWSVNGHKLRTTGSTEETVAGWQTVTFAEPMSVKAGKMYVASYQTGRHMATEGFFRNTWKVDLLKAPRGANGVFAEGHRFPSRTAAGTNFWVDVVYTPRTQPGDDKPTTTRPGVTTSTTRPGVTTTTTRPPASSTTSTTRPSGSTSTTRVPDGTKSRPFSPSSFWNEPLPAKTPVDPNSALYVASLARQQQQYYGGATINTKQYSSAVFTVDRNQPRLKVKYSNCQGKEKTRQEFLDILSAGVPFPDNAVAASGTDGAIVIYQPGTDTLWEFWRAEHRSDGWYVCWGGRIDNVSQSEGVFTKGLGCSASGLSLLGGMIRIEEAKAGRINHALSFGVRETRKGIYSWPANRTDGRFDHPDALIEGQRFRLDPTLDVDSLDITPFAKMMAKAMQTYGAFVRDTSGAVTFTGEDPTPIINATGKNPYDELFGGLPNYKVMRGFPWDRMQALPFDYGK